MSRLLQQSATEQAERRPEAPALVMSGEQLTYAQLEAYTNRIARALRAAGCQRGDRVVLLMPKSIAAIAAILGVLKADGIYVPVDTSSPAPRLGRVIALSEPRCILATSAAVPLLQDLLRTDRVRAPIGIGWLDDRVAADLDVTPRFSAADINRQSPEPLACANTSGDAAYILFTSGSTGLPKGVVITHANVICFMDWATKYFGLGPLDRLSGHPPLHFDLSVFDIFGTFAAGAQLHPVPPKLDLLPNKLADFIRSAELTQWFSVPSVLTYLAKFDVVRFNDFPSLRRLLWCGEVLPTPVLIYWMKRLPAVQFTNLYGPTEATIASSYYTVPRCPDDDKASIPIGTACDGEELLVLDEGLRPTPPEVIGDLYLRGKGLSPGYWRDPETTGRVFIPNPRGIDPSDRIYRTGDLAALGPDKLVYFLGRADSQIKSRGYRIELGEIEAALHPIPALKECAVVAIPTDGFEGTAICCAYVPVAGAHITAQTLRAELAKALPPYMLPSRWRSFDELPKNANGKIDRRQLKEDFERDTSRGS
ncbi:MAG: D-alanine--poly(phosphoribitol) ligase [Candidatus Rokuibacteriota bacterium]|nr:MAG: D-alanine--poly(phosphoribitol) ligase [Candidatus Rokubacteria bacterium]